MRRSAYIGIDVACAKKKRLPLVACVQAGNRLETLPLREWSTRPPSGEGNLVALKSEFQKEFANETATYLRDVEFAFDVRIRRIPIDAPSFPRMRSRKARQCELALTAAKIKYFHTPSWPEFAEIERAIKEHMRKGGLESHLPHANKLWMLLGFALFKRLRRQWECLEVFPQAIVHVMNAARLRKSSPEGYELQRAAAAKHTGRSPKRLASELEVASFGSRHDRLDAFLSAWVASLEESEREAFGVPPNDAIWVPKQTNFRKSRKRL